MDGAWIAPIVFLLVVLAFDAWVYRETKARQAGGRSVVATVGPVTLSMPEQWFLGCLLLRVLIFPLCLVARNASGVSRMFRSLGLGLSAGDS
jgi:hypothetical protein